MPESHARGSCSSKIRTREFPLILKSLITPNLCYQWQTMQQCQCFLYAFSFQVEMRQYITWCPIWAHNCKKNQTEQHYDEIKAHIIKDTFANGQYR